VKKEWSTKEIAEALGKTERAVQRQSKKEGWEFIFIKGRGGEGGRSKRFKVADLPGEIQRALVSAQESLTLPEELQTLAPEAQLEAHKKLMGINAFSASPSRMRREILNPQGGLFKEHLPEERPFMLSPDVLEDPRVGEIAQIVQEAERVPAGCKRSRWIDMVARRYGKAPATVYRYLQKYERAGLAGLKHRKRTRGQARSWTPEAIDFWLGLVLKKEHRKISKESLFECLQYEAAKRGWQIGGYRSALWWLDKRLTPQLLALQRGGVRALDNTLPPICRDYSDLKPFEILVGDQHRFDRWVVDDETGEVYRPEGYFWQDLRTRCFYGGAIAERYDCYLMGLALRIGLRRFGAFGSIYTDHGKPEESKYIAGILKGMRTLGMGMEQTLDIPADLSTADPEEMMCGIMLPGDHRKAVVRNAKAKMIEGTFNQLEAILRNHLKLPGDVKRIDACQEEQEIDHKEAEGLAIAGKLPTFREFVLAVYRAMDFYNSEKPHRGVLREWLWDPRPKKATPMQCLLMCYRQDRWRPRRLPDDAIELAFLPRNRRTVDRGRITFRNQRYEDEALMPLKRGERVEIRFDPLDPSFLLVFRGEEFLCRAEPLEYSSMKDQDLAGRKIAEKARRRAAFLGEYRALTSWVPDFREYSRVPAAERAAAIIGKAKREALRRIEEERERFRERTPEELEAEVRQALDYRPARSRPIFTSERDRYQFVLDSLAQGAEVGEEDRDWMAEYEAKMNADTERYWSIYKDAIGLKS
jgi:putative transposase